LVDLVCSIWYNVRDLSCVEVYHISSASED